MKFIYLTSMLLFIQHTYAQRRNPELSHQLYVIYQDDQRYRTQAIAAAHKYGSGSRQDNELMAKQERLDLANLIKVEKIIKQYGYPGRSLVGSQSKVVFFVVQHNDTEAQERYLPLFQRAAEQNELDRSLLPLMIDRIRTAHGRPQLYGTQLSEVKGSKRIQIKPIEDEIYVDVRRKAMGLPTLESYYKQWGITYKVPTKEGNPNPANLYSTQAEEPLAQVEAIGGDEAILAKLKYPKEASNHQVRGSVLLQYTVDKEGKTKQISVIKGLGYGCDEEAIRVIGEAKYVNRSGEDSELRMRLPFPATGMQGRN